jgi:hypothetical protein
MSVIKEIKEKDARTISAQRKIAFDYLFDSVTDDVMVGDFFIFEYDPKYRQFLRHWDKYPLVLVMNIYDNGFLGANLHYTTQKQRMIIAKKFLNRNVSIPSKLLHRYIFNRADNMFFKVPEKELVEFAALPIEEFRDSKNRFVSAAKVQKSGKTSRK